LIADPGGDGVRPIGILHVVVGDEQVVERLGRARATGRNTGAGGLGGIGVQGAVIVLRLLFAGAGARTTAGGAGGRGGRARAGRAVRAAAGADAVAVVVEDAAVDHHLAGERVRHAVTAHAGPAARAPGGAVRTIGIRRLRARQPV